MSSTEADQGPSKPRRSGAAVSWNGLPPVTPGPPKIPVRRTGAVKKPTPGPDRVGTLHHLAHSCPGFTEGSSRQRIEPWTFHRLLTQNAPVIIPLFQRKYCWEESQVYGWWRDLQLGRGPEIMHSHGVGKVCFKIEADTGNILCIDGQQRITTTLLLMAALLDEYFTVVGSQPTSSATAAGHEDTSATYEAEAKELRQLLMSALFIDPAATDRWAEGITDPTNAGNSNGTATATTLSLDSLFPDGHSLPFSRLQPSYIDRKAFFENVTQGLLRSKLANPAPAAFLLSPIATTARQGHTKRIFDESVQAAVRPLLSGGDEATREKGSSRLSIDGVQTATGASKLLAIRKLRDLYHHALEGMYIIYVEILNEVNLAQVFLWLQEKSLFGMGALLFNAAPGIDFRASDLVRNLLMAPVMNASLEEQEQHHQLLWIDPIERKFRRPVEVDSLLRSWMETYYQECQARVALHSTTKDDNGEEEAQQQRAQEEEEVVYQPRVSAFELQVKSMGQMFKEKGVGKQEQDGMNLYARFYSLYEELLLLAFNTTPQASPQMREVAEEEDDDSGEEEANGDRCGRRCGTPPPRTDAEVREVEAVVCVEILRRLAAHVPQYQEEQQQQQHQSQA